MNTLLYPEELLSNMNMFAGKIMQKLTHEELKSAMDELFGAIELRGGVLQKPFVLLCKEEMGKAMQGIYPELKCITQDELTESAEYDNDILCVVTDEERYPAHYIVLTDAKKLNGYMNGYDRSPQSALIAVKGFKPANNIVIPYEAKEFEEIVWDIIGQVAELEFAEREHDALKSVTIYSDFMLMTLMHLGTVKDRAFLDFAPIKIEHNAKNKSRITLNFKSGTSVTLVPDKEYSEYADEAAKQEIESMKGDMRSTVLDGLFGR